MRNVDNTSPGACGAVFGGFARVVSFLSTCVEVFLDAQREATAAHRRYPFTDW
ncbi:MAG: hypothetical protein WCC54_21255 [Pseudolabrys sp.]